MDIGVPYHLVKLLRNQYTYQEVMVGTEHGTTEWFSIGKGVRQGCILSLYMYLFNLYAECIMRDAQINGCPHGASIGEQTNSN